MSKYIDADALLSVMKDAHPLDYYAMAIKAQIISLPSADVVKVKHGEWEITDAYPHNVYCSVCHKRFAQTHWDIWQDGSLPRNFCPNCGADMRERKETR